MLRKLSTSQGRHPYRAILRRLGSALYKRWIAEFAERMAECKRYAI
jgi:hypothetical protein